jgi:hypothetical protein
VRTLLVFAALGAAACGHNDVFQPQEPVGLPPRGGGAFHRVTFNTGDDRFPTWLPGDSAIAYALEASDELGEDRCIATVRAEGGTRRPLACLHRLGTDSAANSDWPAARDGGRIAYVWEPVKPYPSNGTPDSAIVFIDELTAPGAPRAVFTFPYVEPGVRFYHTVSHLRWLNADTLVAIAITNAVTRDCSACPFRPVRIGRDVVLLDLTTSPATLSVVPGTGTATAVARGPTGNDVYYTIAGDTRVFHRLVATGDSAVVHDFGAVGIARDVSVAGARLAAVVGGSVSYRVDIVGPIQDDSGGPVHLFNVTTGVDSVLPDSGVLYRHPVLAPSGGRLVVEGWRSGQADVWHFFIP